MTTETPIAPATRYSYEVVQRAESGPYITRRSPGGKFGVHDATGEIRALAFELHDAELLLSRLVAHETT